MKDIIKNRIRLSPWVKLQLLALSLKENGLLWTLMTGIYYVSSAVAERSFAMGTVRRAKLDLPGLNSPAMNRLIWGNWDWTSGGEEWTPSPDWKHSVIDNLLKPHIPEASVVLEIGPGSGRWTEALLARSTKYIGVDISDVCVRECQKRFEHWRNAKFVVGSGSDLSEVADDSVDAIWSFDVFMHINKPQFHSYAREFARVLRPGGGGLVQHGSVAGTAGGWESNVTKEDVLTFMEQVGLSVVDQVTEWRDGKDEFRPGLYGDAVTIFRKPNV